MMEHNAADELDIIMPLAEHPSGCLANHGKCFRQKFVKRCALGYPFPELDCLGSKFSVGKRFDRGFQIVDRLDDSAVLFDHSVVFAAEYFGKYPSYHYVSPIKGTEPSG